MGLSNCKRCKKIFNYVNVPYCPDCLKEEEKCYETVRNYIKTHQKSEIREVAEATKIPEKKILQFIKTGKLETTIGLEKVSFECEKCGAPIKSGKYCNECVEDFRQKTNKVFGHHVEKSKTKSEMYTRSMKK